MQINTMTSVHLNNSSQSQNGTAVLNNSQLLSKCDDAELIRKRMEGVRQRHNESSEIFNRTQPKIDEQIHDDTVKYLKNGQINGTKSKGQKARATKRQRTSTSSATTSTSTSVPNSITTPTNTHIIKNQTGLPNATQQMQITAVSTTPDTLQQHMSSNRIGLPPTQHITMNHVPNHGSVHCGPVQQMQQQQQPIHMYQHNAQQSQQPPINHHQQQQQYPQMHMQQQQPMQHYGFQDNSDMPYQQRPPNMQPQPQLQQQQYQTQPMYDVRQREHHMHHNNSMHGHGNPTQYIVANPPTNQVNYAQSTNNPGNVNHNQSSYQYCTQTQYMSLPNDLDLNIQAGLECDVDLLIKHEMSREGRLDFNYDLLSKLDNNYQSQH